MKFKDFKIRYRLISGFTLLIILISIMGALSLSDINNIWSNTEQMYHHPLQVSKAVRDIKININETIRHN